MNGRVYDPNLGRFLSVDPVFQFPTNTQSLNPYSYVLNNPLSMADRNGLWPFYIHNEIIDEAFPGLSKQDLQTLKNASWNMDYGPGQQSPALSFEHGMSDGVTGQTGAQAAQQADAFIAQNEHDAQQIQADWIKSGHTGIAPGALTAFGNALHTIEDKLSPAHIGYQPWYGQSGWNPSAWAHVLHESYITPFQMNLATSAAQQAFGSTFGIFGYDVFDLSQVQQRQPLPPPPTPRVTTQICYTLDGGTQVFQ